MEKMLIVDGNSMLFRAFYATSYGNIMMTSDGIYTNAVYAFANMLNKAIVKLQPNYVVVAFDKGKHTFRHEIYKDYKAGRKQTPQELVPQFKLVRDMLNAYNISFLEFDDIEADDIIGTLSEKYKEENVITYILSSDKDMLQLVDKDTNVLIMKKGISDILEINVENIYENYGLLPKQVIDYKALRGDDSDNIKGIDGVGDKTALKLIGEYDNIENIYDNIDKIKGKLKEKIIAGKENAFLSKRLATIKTDVEFKTELKDYILSIDEEKLKTFFLKYEMNSLVKNTDNLFFNRKKENTKNKEFTFKNEFSKEVLKEGSIVFFYNDNFNYYDNNCYLIGIINDNNLEIAKFENVIKQDDFIEFLSSNVHKYSYDLKVNLHLLEKYNCEIKNCDDLLLMNFLINNKNQSINEIFNFYNLPNVLNKVEVFGTELRVKELDFSLIYSQTEQILNNFWSLHKKAENLIKQYDMERLYYEVELPLIYVLKDMEKSGIFVKKDILIDFSKQLIDKIECLKNEIFKIYGKEFNINSPKQLAIVLFDDLKLKENKKRSTSIEILEFLEDKHPIIKPIIEYRHYSKILSAYSDGLIKFIHDDGRIHTIFSQTTTQTGRLSSSEPNLQNLTVRNEDGKEIRKAFVHSENSILISCDYSQIELRILAHITNENNLIDAFNNGLDVHTKTAMDIFDIPRKQVDSNIRRKAKAINFGIIYGISEFGLSKQANITVYEAKDFMEKYFNKYPKIKKYMVDCLSFLNENGYVKTILNRRRYIDEIRSSSYTIREFAKRAAFNSPIQGSGADIIKLAMINIYNEIKRNKLKSKLILQIHDELIFDVKNDELEIMTKIIKEGMKKAYALKVDLDFDFHISESLNIEK